MKIMSFAVPCYNSQDYMSHCIDTLLDGGDEVEILIVDDGSKDNTAAIADEYERKYPGICKAIHQPNGGHGEAVNTGIRNASGVFFKVVDSDDWVDHDAYMQVLDKLKEFVRGGQTLDMMVCNFVYEKQGAKKKKVMTYRFALPANELITWNEVRHFHKGQYLLMHSVIYRTKLLQDSGLKLPSHTFYVDNIFVFEPLVHVKTMYYLNVNFYRYFIGRDDQSVNEKVMISRVDQQIRVTKIMIDYLAGKNIQTKKLRRYMESYLDIIMCVSSIMLIRANTDEALQKKKELWEYLKKKDRWLYIKIRYGFLGNSMNLPGKGGRKLSVGGYKLVHWFVGFN
ncbi:Glycosyltransferase involved in cell wall bisynthesis [Lachnospiraceae bacterium KH1T2]|nr:Glycosyltransferase involved in cell wall bisynthesis [Lachnospiraceae bacterium KH1T2]